MVLGKKHLKKWYFLVVTPLRSGYTSPPNLSGSNLFYNFFITWKWSKMDKTKLINKNSDKLNLRL